MKKSNHLKNLYENTPGRFEKPVHLGWRIILLTIILTLIFGFLAGLGGGLIVLITRTVKIPFYKEFNLDELLPKREITIKTKEVISVLPDEQVEELIKQVENQVVKIFLKKKDPKKILEQIYRDEESLGQGFILTDDGWVVAYGSYKTTESYVIATSDKKIYPVKKILLDPLTDTIFLKIEAKNLEVTKLAESEEISLGQQVLILDGAGQVKVARIQNMNYESGIMNQENSIESTDKFSRFIQLDQEMENIFAGSPVVNLKGSVIGNVGRQKSKVKSHKLEEKKPEKSMINTVIPVTLFKSLINQVLKDGKNLANGSYLARPSLGIDYLNLAQSRGITDKRYKDLRRGVLVWGSPVKDSPAEKAGFKNADVILKVNNDLVNGRHSLTELIQEYKVGDKVELTVLRGGKEEKVKVELGVLSHE